MSESHVNVGLGVEVDPPDCPHDEGDVLQFRPRKLDHLLLGGTGTEAKLVMSKRLVTIMTLVHYSANHATGGCRHFHILQAHLKGKQHKKTCK